MADWPGMHVLDGLQPQDKVETDDLRRGLRMMLLDGIFATMMVSMSGGAILVGFVLMLGASNISIGLLSAIPPLSQLLQLPAIVLVEKTRLRKMVVVVSAFLSRVSWVGMVVLPWMVPAPLRLPAFFVFLFAFYGIGAFAGCAYNSWVRDLIPERIMGRFFASRMAWAIASGALASMAAGAGIDFFKTYLHSEAAGYSVVFGVATVFGLFSLGFLARMPEPRMHAPATTNLWGILSEPFRDPNYRSLLVFLAWWNFAVNFAAPFFAVYMLKNLGLTMTWIIALGVLSQIINVIFLRLWGRLADRFSNKSVLTVAAPMFIITFLMWPFTLMPDRYFLTVPILIMIHCLGGISTAGMMLSASNLALKIAPHGKATAYLAMNGLVSGVAATVAPLLAGLAAAGFAHQTLSVSFQWASHGATPALYELHPIMIKDLDFLFILAFVLGLEAVHRLLAIKEEGEVTEQVVIHEFYSEIRRSMRGVSQIFGLRVLTHIPLAALQRVAEKTNALLGDVDDTIA